MLDKAPISYKKEIFSGIKWNILGIIFGKGTDFLIKLILARLLFPEAFGLVGIAMVVINFIDVMADMGLFNALVQRKEDKFTENIYSTSFWFLISFGSCLLVLIWTCISVVYSDFYDNSDLIPVINALAVSLFFSIMNIVPRVILTKSMLFHILVKNQITCTIISALIGIGLALSGYGVWSIVFQSISKSVINSLLLFIKVDWRPKFIFKFSHLLELANYSIYTQLNSILFFLRANLDVMLIGRLLSIYSLGVYSLVYQLTEVVRSQFYSILNKVYFPLYSKIQDDLGSVKKFYLQAMHFTAAITFPLSIITFSLSEEILNLFFGEKWISGADILQVLSVASMIFSISGTPAEVLKGIGRPKISFYISFFNTIFVVIPSLYFGITYYGAIGAAYAVCIYYTSSRILYHFAMKRFIKVSEIEVLKALSKPLLASFLMFLTIYVVKLLLFNIVFCICISVLLGLTVYMLFFRGDIVKAINKFF